jgi:hypothetical protein
MFKLFTKSPLSASRWSRIAKLYPKMNVIHTGSENFFRTCGKVNHDRGKMNSSFFLC